MDFTEKRRAFYLAYLAGDMQKAYAVYQQMYSHERKSLSLLSNQRMAEYAEQQES